MGKPRKFVTKNGFNVIEYNFNDPEQIEAYCKKNKCTEEVALNGHPEYGPLYKVGENLKHKSGFIGKVSKVMYTEDHSCEPCYILNPIDSNLAPIESEFLHERDLEKIYGC